MIPVTGRNSTILQTLVRYPRLVYSYVNPLAVIVYHMYNNDFITYLKAEY